MSLTTPLQSAVAALKSRVETDLENVVVYDFWPPQRGLKLPAVSIWLVNSRQEEVGVGQIIDANTKGVLHVYTFQLDVWGRSPNEILEIADQIKVSFFQNRSSFGNYIKDIVKVGERWIGLEQVEEVPGVSTEERVYRLSLEFKVTYAITQTAS